MPRLKLGIQWDGKVQIPRTTLHVVSVFGKSIPNWKHIVSLYFKLFSISTRMSRVEWILNFYLRMSQMMQVPSLLAVMHSFWSLVTWIFTMSEVCSFTVISKVGFPITFCCRLYIDGIFHDLIWPLLPPVNNALALFPDASVNIADTPDGCTPCAMNIILPVSGVCARIHPSDHPLRISFPSGANSMHSATTQPSSGICKSCLPVFSSHNRMPSSPHVANTASRPL